MKIRVLLKARNIISDYAEKKINYEKMCWSLGSLDLNIEGWERLDKNRISMIVYHTSQIDEYNFKIRRYRISN